MNLYHLKYFQDAAATGSVARSASMNRISPSAVSQAIRALERDLSVELVSHARRRLELTEHGKKLLELGPEVFGLVQRIREDVRDPHHPVTGTLTLGVSHSTTLALLGDFLASFSGAYPGILLHLKTGPTLQLQEMVRTRAVEFAVFVDDGNSRGLERQVIRSGRFVAAARARNSGPAHRFLVTEVRPDLTQFLSGYRRRFHIEADIIMQIESWEIIAHLAAAGMGVAVVPDFLLRGPLAGKLKVLDLGLPEITYDLCLARHRTAALSQNARIFTEAMVRHIATH